MPAEEGLLFQHDITILGNDHAALLGENILKKQNKIDVISTAEHGECMFVPFLSALESGTNFDQVPEMIYRNQNNIIKTEETVFDVHCKPFGF